MKKILLPGFLLLSAMCLFLSVSGCGSTTGTETESPVWLEVVGITHQHTAGDNTVALIDVCALVEDTDTGTFGCSFQDEVANVSFVVNTDDPDFDSSTSSTQYLDVHISHYRVSFFRNDGGSNVPGTFDMYTDLYCEFGAISTFGTKLLHADQKLSPPLIWLNSLESFGYEPDTGLTIIKGYAVMQFWGQDNSGYNVDAQTQIPVQFADWAN